MNYIAKNAGRRHRRMSAAAPSPRLVAAGGFVLAMPVLSPARGRGLRDRRRRHAARHRQRPARLRRDRRRRHGHHRRPPLRDGHRASRTSLPMVVADEMGADWARVHIVQAPGDEPKYGNQDTDGSRSMRHFIQPMRQCGAAMRQMLEPAAASAWGVPLGEVEAGEPRGRAQRLRPEARLRRAAPRRRWRCRCRRSSTLKLKDPAGSATSARATVAIYDLHDITTGKAVYGADVTAAGHEIRRGRPPAGGRRQGEVVRRRRRR